VLLNIVAIFTNRGASYFVPITTYYYADQIKENEVGRACGTHGRGGKRVQGFGGKARRKETLGKPRRRCEDGIKIDLTEIGWGVWSGFTWLRIGTGGGLL
jgi:hypothetical protein